MAPVRIQHVVSFTSQDPKFPVENLLREEGGGVPRLWLCSTQDRSRRLAAEFQLERASPIGYVDVGNCGSAFLQIEVGRSSWPLDQGFLTLLPTTALMTPAEARVDKNRAGVRMFKAGDFLAPTRAEKWDRVRLTCSQPFHRTTQFGLTFLRIRTPLDTEDAKAPPAPSESPNKVNPEIPRDPWLSSAAICRTFFPEEPASTEEEEALKARLRHLDPAASPGSAASLSRPARMVLEAASARKRPFPLVPDSSPLAIKGGGERGRGPQVPQDLGSKPESSVRRDRRKTSRRRGPGHVAGRSREVSRRKDRKGKLLDVEKEEEEEEEEGRDGANWPEDNMGGNMGTCPICEGRFPAGLLLAHASGCGEEDWGARPSSPPLWEWPGEAQIRCPICQSAFRASEVESHASTCGDLDQPSASSSPWLWVE